MAGVSSNIGVVRPLFLWWWRVVVACWWWRVVVACGGGVWWWRVVVACGGGVWWWRVEGN
jgi:hypothetical protein